MCLFGFASASGVVARGQVILLMGPRVLIYFVIRLAMLFFVPWIRFWSAVIFVILFFMVCRGLQDLFDVMSVLSRSWMTLVQVLSGSRVSASVDNILLVRWMTCTRCCLRFVLFVLWKCSCQGSLVKLSG